MEISSIRLSSHLVAGLTVHSTWLEVLTDPIRLRVMLALSTTGKGSAAELAQSCHASERTVKRHLDALLALGLIRQLRNEPGSDRRGRPPTRFILDSAVRDDAREVFSLLSQPLGPSS
jgi:predicted ArsR family transcriptional regulator